MAITARRIGPTMRVAMAQVHNVLMQSRATALGNFHADQTSLPRISEGDMLYSPPTPYLVTASNATDMPSCIALMNNIFQLVQTHMLDGASAPLYGGLPATQAGAHKVPDTTDLANIAAVFVTNQALFFGQIALQGPNGFTYTATGNAATDLAAVIARANQLKASINAHLPSMTFHFTADNTNTIGASNAADLPTSITLLNATKAAVNAHVASAPAGYQVNVIAT